MTETNKSLSFEDAVARLEQIVKELEGEAISIEESLKLFEQGKRLTEMCRTQLEDAERRIKTLSKGKLEAGETKSE